MPLKKRRFTFMRFALLMACICLLGWSCSKEAYRDLDAHCIYYWPENMVYVPQKIVKLGAGRIHKINAMWITESEISNKMYRAFVDDMKNYASDVSALLPDTNVIHEQLWISRYRSYFWDPLFDDFPVVGLTKLQMEGYALWLSEQMNAMKYSCGYDFRLPTKEEWQHAASGGRQKTNVYALGVPVNSEGCFLFNFFWPSEAAIIYGSKDSMFYHGDISQKQSDSIYQIYKDITNNFTKRRTQKLFKFRRHMLLPDFVDSYHPNDYGLYNVNGNVAEMTAEGEVMGGSYRMPYEYCKLTGDPAYPYDASIPQADIGFRLVCTYRSLNERRISN